MNTHRTSKFWTTNAIVITWLSLVVKSLFIFDYFSVSIMDDIGGYFFWVTFSDGIWFFSCLAFAKWFGVMCKNLRQRAKNFNAVVWIPTPFNMIELFEKTNGLLKENNQEGGMSKLKKSLWVIWGIAWFACIVLAFPVAIYPSVFRDFREFTLWNLLCIPLGLIAIKIIKDYSKIEEKLKDLDVLYREHRKKFLAQNPPATNQSATIIPNHQT